MSQAEHEAAVAAFLRTNSITRCPTACAVPTRANVPEPDRLALRDYNTAREAARLQKARLFQLVL